MALACNGEGLQCTEAADNNFIHAEKLHVFIEDTLKIAGLKPSDLQAIAVSAGPGSYTGLRIGTSAAKGLSYALQIPLLAISTTSILIEGVPAAIQSNYLIAAIDARRQEIYTQIFDSDKNPFTEIEALVVNEDSFSAYHNICLVGDGAEKTAQILKRTDIKFIQQNPSAKHMAALSYQKWMANSFENLAYFEPFYLKEFVAGKPKKIVNPKI